MKKIIFSISVLCSCICSSQIPVTDVVNSSINEATLKLLLKMSKTNLASNGELVEGVKTANKTLDKASEYTDAFNEYADSFEDFKEAYKKVSNSILTSKNLIQIYNKEQEIIDNLKGLNTLFKENNHFFDEENNFTQFSTGLLFHLDEYMSLVNEIITDDVFEASTFERFSMLDKVYSEMEKIENKIAETTSYLRLLKVKSETWPKEVGYQRYE